MRRKQKGFIIAYHVNMGLDTF